MKRLKRTKIWVMLAFWGLANGAAYGSDTHPWQKLATGITDPVTSLYYSPQENSFILAGTTKAIYRTETRPGSQYDFFVPVLTIHSSSQTINQIYSNPTRPSYIYAATDAGIYISFDTGKNWSNIFSPLNPEARKCLSVFSDGESVYAGTANGLYVRENDEKNWQKQGGELGRKPIYRLVEDEKYIYAATGADIYRLEKLGDEFKRVFNSGSREMTLENGDTAVDGPAEAQSVRDITVFKDNALYLTTDERVMVSRDHGETWQDLAGIGLPSQAVNSLLINGPKDILAATDQGAFRYLNGRWQSETAGLDSHKISDLAFDPLGNILAATDRGIYTTTFNVPRSTFDAENKDSEKEIIEGFEKEPSITEVQRLAIRYAQVNPGQISKWHHEARARALVPSLSVGVSRADTELFHWDTGGNPDVLRRGRDYVDWSASFSWDFGDLVWSSDHTSIDSRSKLMSELRQDILDQITRLYFERRRLQFELAKLEGETIDHFDRQMRVEELTALIDGFTGGEFSKRITNYEPRTTKDERRITNYESAK